VALAFSLFEIVPVKAQEPGANEPAPSGGMRKMGEARPATRSRATHCAGRDLDYRFEWIKRSHTTATKWAKTSRRAWLSRWLLMDSWWPTAARRSRSDLAKRRDQGSFALGLQINRNGLADGRR